MLSLKMPAENVIFNEHLLFLNQIPRVHGIEFTFDKLKKKMDLNFGKINYTGKGKKPTLN